jgi:glycosyltransferase involved in cell wall biosynthesis
MPTTSPKTVIVLGGFGESLVRFRGDLIAEIVTGGDRVIACAPDADDATIAQLQARGARHERVPMQRAGTNPLADLRTLWALLRLFRRERPDALFAYTIKPVVYGTLAAWLARIPVRVAMITGLGYAFTDGGGNRRRARAAAVARWLYRIALPRCSRVVFQNPDDRDLFVRLGLLPPRVPVSLVAGSGIDTGRFVPQPLPPMPSCLMIARLVRDKGVVEYVEAARIVRRQRPDVAFRLAGWIDVNPTAVTPEQLRSWCDEGVIEYLGRLDDVRPALAGCVIYVLPSYREGTPRTVLEAMACGRAVVTTDAPGCRETVEHGDNGLLVPVADARALAQALLELLADPARVQRFGERGRRRAEDRFDVRLVNRMLIEGLGLK